MRAIRTTVILLPLTLSLSLSALAAETIQPGRPINSQPLVLMYHEIVETPQQIEATADLTRAQLREQLEYLKSNGYFTISLEQLEAAKQGTVNLNPKSMVITFDDGFAGSVASAAMLEEFGFQANFFVHTDYVGTEPNPEGPLPPHTHATWDDLRALEKNPLFHVYSHTVSHPKLADLAEQIDGIGHYAHLSKVEREAARTKLRTELIQSCDRIKQELEHTDCGYIAYPYGSLNRHVEEGAMAFGYRLGFAIDVSSNDHIPAYAIPRMILGSKHFSTLEGFKNAIRVYRNRYQRFDAALQ